jgi:hypothetical protein
MPTGLHKRNFLPMLNSVRCGAKTRKGGSSRAPAVAGKKRCRMHGGAKGSGAPFSNDNAVKHGGFTKTAIKRRAIFRDHIRQAQKFLKDLDD